MACRNGGKGSWVEKKAAGWTADWGWGTLGIKKGPEKK